MSLDAVLTSEIDAEQQLQDLLNRQPFVDQLISVTNILAENKKNACFALNGSWGIGKSFVLKMFEEQVSDIQTPATTMGKYLLFHYDCWKYDYYEEPLMAIVAALLDAIDTQVNLLQEDVRERIKGVLKVIGTALAEKVNKTIAEKTGLNSKEICEFLAGVNDKASQKVEESHEFDKYFIFSKTLQKLRDTIESLAKDQTVVFVVDELDRCLPEYTIKVLERLHHVFEDIPNVQMILSIDKGQLEHTVKQIYGPETDAKKYLEKFISFEISLPIGSLNDQAECLFENYSSLFENVTKIAADDDLLEFKRIILEGINTRSRIAIIEKCELLHRIITKEDSISDTLLMCIEVFLTVLKYYDIDILKAKSKFSFARLFEADETCAGNTDYTLPGLAILRTKYNDPHSEYYDASSNVAYYSRTQYNRRVILCPDIWGVLLACYRAILGFEGDSWIFSKPADRDIKQYVLDYWKLLKIID